MKKPIVLAASVVLLAVPVWASAAKSVSNHSIKQAWPTKYGAKKQPQNETQSRKEPANDKAKAGGKPAGSTAANKK